MSIESENRFRREINQDFENYIKDKYDFEIKLDLWKSILILILNILTGGLGTLLVPFLNQKKKKFSIILAALLLSILQIFHFLHFFSVLSKVQFLEKIYDDISSDNFLESIFEGEDNSKKSIEEEYYNEFNEDNNVYNEDNENNDEKSIIGEIIDNLKFNITDTIPQKSRKKFLKSIFLFISGMSYANSIFTTLVNFFHYDNEKNRIFAYKVVLYSIFNPGGGILLASFALIPSCTECQIKEMILYIISIIISIIIILSPVSLSIGLFLTVLTKKMITLFPLKLLLIYIGVFGFIISILTSGINKSKILEVKESLEKPLKAFDIVYKCGKQLVHLNTTFGLKSFIRLLSNILIPGTGTISLMCKYDNSKCAFFLIGIIQFFIGCCFFINIILVVFQYIPIYELFLVFFNLENTIDIKYIISFLNLLFSIGLNFYFSGLFLILISDYNQKDIHESKEISGIACIILNIFTGSLGTILFGNFFLTFSRKEKLYVSVFGFLIFVLGGFICFVGVQYCIFFPEVSKACKIAYPICYCVNSIVIGSIPFIDQLNKDNLNENGRTIEYNPSCPAKKLYMKESNYENKKLIEVEIFN